MQKLQYLEIHVKIELYFIHIFIQLQSMRYYK